MAVEVFFPRVDMDMSEGKIARWYVRDGDTVTKGQVVFEIETDKATMEIEASADGVIQGIVGSVGETIQVGQVLAWILQSGESLPIDGPPSAGSALPHAALAAKPPQGLVAAVPKQPVRATPLARSMAREQGVELQTLRGSGQGGRIYAADLARPNSTPPVPVQANAGLHLQWFARQGGIPLVLLHGFGSDLGSWRPLATLLADISIVGLDLPNHGKSARAEIRSLGDVARAALARLDAEGIGAMHLMGHSLGGGAALAMAGLLKDRLRSLTLLAPVGLGPEINNDFIRGILRASREESLRPWLAQLFGNAGLLSASFVATAMQQLASEDRRAALAGMAETLFPDGTQAVQLRDQLLGLAMPVKVVWGSLDRVVPIHQAHGLPGSVALHVLAGVGHLPQVEATELMLALVRQQMTAGASGKL